MKARIYIVFLLVALALGCQKKELEPTVLTLLTDNDVKSWQTVAIETDGINDEPCRNDDIFVFSLFDDELELPYWQIQDNLVACSSSDQSYIIGEGFWRINNQQDRLTLTLGRPGEGDNINLVFNIEYITESELRLRTEIEDEYGFFLKYEYITLRRL